MNIGIYTPYLTTYGGGEKYICKIAEILSTSHNVEFLVFEKPDVEKLEKRLNVNLKRVRFKNFEIPRLFDLPKIRTLFRDIRIPSITKFYDLFLNQENHTAIFAHAKRNIYLCQVPPKASLFSLKKIVNKLFFDNNLKTYHLIVANSLFTKKELVKRYPYKKIDVLYPPIDVEKFPPLSKENIILSVGRFFKKGHSKKQLEMIKVFKDLINQYSIEGKWEYHLIGGVSGKNESRKYLEKCKEEAAGYPIYFHINAPFKELKEMYGKSKIFWHATGLNENTQKHPERMEHFGMTTAEAMAAGCVPVVINKGGQPEIVRNMVDGFLWNAIDEMEEYTLKLIRNGTLWKKMSQSSINRAKEFSVKNFEKKVREVLLK